MNMTEIDNRLFRAIDSETEAVQILLELVEEKLSLTELQSRFKFVVSKLLDQYV